MIEVLSTNIVSPIGGTAYENYKVIKAGLSSVTKHDDQHILPETICASLFKEASLNKYLHPGLTKFESLVYYSISEALQRVRIESDARTILILASTKGNIENLRSNGLRVNLAESASVLAKAIPVVSDYVVVCNACISGASAQLLALRLIESDCYDYAIVCGADVTGQFIASGFSSLKALSSEPCRPFDMERNGLNLGEAAATIIYGKGGNSCESSWHLQKGAIRNDAHHISNPPSNAEGCYLAIKSVLADNIVPACVSVHGTATLFNDQMEAVALHRAGLSDVPVLALKGYYGHTLGATGVLETILSMYCVDDKETVPAVGYSEQGVSYPLNISASPIPIAGDDFLKIISGFGGCNAALYFFNGSSQHTEALEVPILRTTHRITITSDGVILDNKSVEVEGSGKSMITALYKKYINDYPRFYKMDMLSRVALIASELLIQAENPRVCDTEDRAIIFFNHSSSIVADCAYLATLTEDNYYPSPSVFIYTLPNITAGEIAIRNKYHGETSFYIMKEKSERLMNDILSSTFMDKGIRSAICGWLNCDSEDQFEVEMFIKERN